MKTIPSMSGAMSLFSGRALQVAAFLMALVCVAGAGPAVQAAGPGNPSATPPGQAETGYGSSDHYISPGYVEHEIGSDALGTRVWSFVPEVLKNGDRAPVVVFFHGWTAIDPDLYRGHIEHLTKQGIIVIYPQYQKSGVVGVFTDLDQNRFLTRAVQSVDAALEALGSIADTSEITAYGHSLGGLLAFCWNGASTHPARALVLANASLEGDEGVPDEVPIVVIDWRVYAPLITVPVFFLTGDGDPLSVDSLLGFEAVVNARFPVVYMAASDDWGTPPIRATHTAPLSAKGEDTLDYRFYYAALDAAIDNQVRVTFDMGRWSDGQPVVPVAQLAP